MGLFSRRKRRSLLPYDMFETARESYDDKKAAKLENVYHRSHKRAWNGKKILPMLIEKHGKPSLPVAEKKAIARLFAVILWGELAAWKISLQLADRVVPLEAKMAATSQAFDEARHFYTMRDYLSALDCGHEILNPKTEKAIKMILGTNDLAQKMVGMQLMVEPIALTIFQTVKERRIEPVLSDLLQYYEIDEANHVAFGINYLPSLVDGLNRWESVKLSLFQARLFFWTIASIRRLRGDFLTLGIDPRDVVNIGKAKQFVAFGETMRHLGVDISNRRSILERFVEAANEILFPYDGSTGKISRIKLAFQRLFADANDIDEGMRREMADQLAQDPDLKDLGSTGEYWRKKEKAA